MSVTPQEDLVDSPEPKHYWVMKHHLRCTEGGMSIWHCPTLDIYKQQETGKGYRIKYTIYFFSAGEDEPVWEDFSEILAEAKYRLCCQGD